MAQLLSFVDSDDPSYVCKLRKAISLFVFNTGGHIIYLLIYVDDIIIIGDSDVIIQQFVALLAQCFSLKDLELLNYFSDVEVLSHKHGLLLSHHLYIMDLLSRNNMIDSKPVVTPLATSPTFMLHSGSALFVLTEYQTIIGSFQYLSLTQPDITFVVNKLSQVIHPLLLIIGLL